MGGEAIYGNHTRYHFYTSSRPCPPFIPTGGWLAPILSIRKHRRRGHPFQSIVTLSAAERLLNNMRPYSPVRRHMITSTARPHTMWCTDNFG